MLSIVVVLLYSLLMILIEMMDAIEKVLEKEFTSFGDELGKLINQENIRIVRWNTMDLFRGLDMYIVLRRICR